MDEELVLIMTEIDSDITLIPKRLEESLLLRFILLGDRLKKRRDRISQELGISTQQWLFLLHVAKDPNIPFFDGSKHKKDLMPNEIASTFGTSRSNITALIHALSAKELLKLSSDDGDKRRKRLSLTDKGIALISSLQDTRQMMNNKLFDGFQSDELEDVLDFVDKFIRVNTSE